MDLFDNLVILLNIKLHNQLIICCITIIELSFLLEFISSLILFQKKAVLLQTAFN